MSLNLDKSTWKRVALGDVAEASKEKCDPNDGSVERYVAGEHMDTDNLKITKWGEVGDGYLGPAFHRRFHPGQVLYGSRRTYLRKVAVADFEGVCANTTFVIQSCDPDQLLDTFLPLILTAERFHSFAIAESKGSVNPYVNWSDIAKYEFDLPPIDEQKRVAELMWSVERHRRDIQRGIDAATQLTEAHLEHWMKLIASESGTVPLDTLIEDERPVTYGILMPGYGHPAGVPVVKVKDFPCGFICEDDLLLTSPELAHEYRRSTLREGDLLISIRGTIGRLAEVPKSLDGANITQDTARLSIAAPHDRRYVRLVLESGFAQRQIRKHSTGLAVKGLNLGALRKLEIPIPKTESWETDLVEQAAEISEVKRKLESFFRANTDVAAAFSSEIFGDTA